ncbi:MAG: hypothetical protein ACKVOW_07505 [Chitinophagaceae bacterium]
MKKNILSTAMVAIIMMAGLSTFAQQDKQAEKARKKIAEGKKDLREAKLDSAADYEKFVKEAEMSISENKKEIAILKEKKIESNASENEKYHKKVITLEKQNNELQKRIKDSEHTKTSMWERFKVKFNRDLKNLGRAIKNI